MMRGSSLLLEGESHQLFCRVFLDETLSHFCWEDDDLRSTALPLEFVDDIIVMEALGSDEDSGGTLPVFALVLSNEQILKVTCPNSSEFQLWFYGLHRLLNLSQDIDEDHEPHGQSPARNNAQRPEYEDEDAAALAPYDYEEDNEEYGDGHAVSNTFSPSASLRNDATRQGREAEGIRQQMHAVQQRLAEAEAALRAFDANSESSKASGQYDSYNDATPPAPAQSPSYKRFQPQSLAVESHNADAGTGKFYDESESVDTDIYASSASKDEEYWRAQDDAESTSGYTSTSHDTATQAESQLSAMQNSILLLCDQVQDLRGKLSSSRPSSSKKSKFDELTRAKRELMRVREENEALAARCRELSLMQTPPRHSDVQQVMRLLADVCIGGAEHALLFYRLTFPGQEHDLENLKEEVHRLNGMLQTAVSVNARRQAEVQAFKESVTRLLVERGVVDADHAL
jgi:hypothetical protein